MGKAAIAFKDIGKAASGARSRAAGGTREARQRALLLSARLLCTDLLSKDFKVGQNKVEVKSKTSNGVVRRDTPCTAAPVRRPT